MTKIIRFEPIPRPAIWGHTKLRDFFNYTQFPKGIGQSWSFSAQETAANVVINGPYKGETLLSLWKKHPDLFRSDKSHFPFIIGLVAPEDNLSIQVHPDSDFAKSHGLLSGKNEAWYFIDADTGSDLVYGTKVRNKETILRMIEDNAWDDIVRKVPVKKDDFVYIPAGMLHALQKNVVVYEVQEATDVTYRFYDYDRKDEYGNTRELHLKEAIASLKMVDDPIIDIKHYHAPSYDRTVYIENEYFTIEKYTIYERATISVEDYKLFTLVEGSMVVDGEMLEKGDSFLAPHNTKEIVFKGCGTFMVTSEGIKE